MSQPKEYKNKFAISQSAIKDWKEMSPKKWYDKWIMKNRVFKTSESLEFGNLLDTIIFSNHLFDKRFILSEVAKPSEKVSFIVKCVYDRILELNKNADDLNIESKGKLNFCDDVKIPHKELTLEDNEDLVNKYCVEHEHWMNDLKRGYNDIIKKGKDYFEFLKKVGNKIVITNEQHILAKELKDRLLSDPVSRGFFLPKAGCEVLFQQQIFADFELEGYDTLEFLAMKGIPDIIHINHKRKEIREVDLKFTNDVFKFYEAIRRFDYPMQHSVYDFLINEWIKTFEKGKYKDYVVANPLNVVIDDVEKIPYLYTYTASDLAIKRTGIENTKILGWEQILREIAWHLDTNQWERPRQHYLNGFITIEIFNKR